MCLKGAGGQKKMCLKGAGGQKKLRLTDSGKNMMVENSYFIQFLLI